MEHIESVYSSYEEIINYFGEERISSRIEFFLDAMSKFITSLNYGIGDIDVQESENVSEIRTENILKINESVLSYCIMDYFTDIYRLKKFHNIPYVNNIKIVSYQSSWILRRKPIQILSDDIKHDNITYANEKFVLSYITHELMRSTSKDNLSSEGYAKLSSFVDSLFYYLKYRNCEPKILELMMLSFEAGVGICS